MNDLTQVLAAINQGAAKAAEQLLPLVYDELRMRQLTSDWSYN